MREDRLRGKKASEIIDMLKSAGYYYWEESKFMGIYALREQYMIGVSFVKDGTSYDGEPRWTLLGAVKSAARLVPDSEVANGEILNG